MKKILFITLLFSPLVLEVQASRPQTARAAGGGGRGQQQATTGRVAGGVARAAASAPVAGVASAPAPVAVAVAAVPAPVAFEGVEVTRHNVFELYTRCMSSVCFAEATGLCQCREGSEQFALANASCAPIAAAIPHREAEVLADFRRRAANDCAGVALHEVAAGAPVTRSQALANLTVCMRRACTPRGMGMFEGCFDDEGLAERFEECADSYAGYLNPPALKVAFRRQILTYKAHFCTENWGNMVGEDCYVNIGIGPRNASSIRSLTGVREFRVGDNIICSHQAFDVRARTDDRMFLQARQNTVVSSIRLAGTVASGVGAIMSADGAAETGLVATGMVATVAGDGLGVWVGATIMGMDRPEFPALCFLVRGVQLRPVFHEDPDVFYQLRFSTDWQDRGRDIRRMGR